MGEYRFYMEVCGICMGDIWLNVGFTWRYVGFVWGTYGLIWVLHGRMWDLYGGHLDECGFYMGFVWGHVENVDLISGSCGKHILSHMGVHF